MPQNKLDIRREEGSEQERTGMASILKTICVGKQFPPCSQLAALPGTANLRLQRLRRTQRKANKIFALSKENGLRFQELVACQGQQITR